MKLDKTPDEAAAWLITYLLERGPSRVDTIIRDARIAGFPRGLIHKAKRFGVLSRNDPNNPAHWYWSLNPDGPFLDADWNPTGRIKPNQWGGSNQTGA